MKLKNYTFIVLLIAVAQLNVSMAYAQNVVDIVNQLQTELYLQTLTDDPLSVIDDIKSKYGQSYNSWSDEDKLFFDNILAIEKANFLPKSDATQAYVLLQKQDLLCEEFFKDKNPEDVNKWFLTSWADIKSRLLLSLSGMDVIKQSTETKNLYKEALEKDEKFSTALRGSAMWLFYAPFIAGGGNNKALKQMALAVENAQTDIEVFFALCYRSQVLFAMGEQEESLKDFEKVHNLFPEEILTSMMRDANANGKNFF